MKRILQLVVVMMVASVVHLAEARADGAAKPVTLTGKIACAMCILKQPGVTSCKNVLVVPEGDQTAVYALTENAVTKAYDMAACEKAVPVRVTGTVSGSGTKKAIAASKIEKA